MAHGAGPADPYGIAVKFDYRRGEKGTIVSGYTWVVEVTDEAGVIVSEIMASPTVFDTAEDAVKNSEEVMRLFGFGD
ncbi:MAG: hypothetical protein OYH76_24720 [Defluviicoccus sp.]|nr:hypothetical protein [Defluviicoccus sp.]MDE0279112.1 hypothetical protein [Defluviicoccus sp.]